MLLQLLNDLSGGNFEAVERILAKAPNRLVETRSALAHSRIRALVLDSNIPPGTTEYLVPVGTNRAIASLFMGVDRLLELFDTASALSPANRIYSIPPLFLFIDNMLEASRELRGSMAGMLPKLLDYVRRADADYVKLGFVYLISQLFVRGIVSTQQDLRPLAEYISQDLYTCGDYYITLLYTRIIIQLRPFHLEMLDPDAMRLQPLATLTQLNFASEGPKAVCALADATPIGEHYFRLRHLQFSHGRMRHTKPDEKHDLGGGILVCGRISLCLVFGPSILLRLHYDSLTRIQISYRRALMLITFPLTLLPRLSALRDWKRSPSSSSSMELDTWQSQEVTLELIVDDPSALVAFRDDTAPLIAHCRTLVLYSASQSADDLNGSGGGMTEAFQNKTFSSFDALSQYTLNESSGERRARRAAIYVLPIRYSVIEPPIKADVSPSPEVHSPELLRPQGGGETKVTNPFSSASVSCTPKDLLRATSSIDVMELKAKHDEELLEFRTNRGAHLKELVRQLRSDEEVFNAICSDFKEELALGYEVFWEMWQRVNSSIKEYKQDLMALQLRQRQELNSLSKTVENAPLLDHKRARLLELRKFRRPKGDKG